MLNRCSVRYTSEARNRKLIDATRYCIAQDALSTVYTSYVGAKIATWGVNSFASEVFHRTWTLML